MDAANDSLISRNRDFLQTHFPGVWEAYQAAPPMPATIPDLFEIPLPNSQKVELSVTPDIYAEEHQRAIASLGSASGALVWGVTLPEELVWYRHILPRGPFLYIESDPAAFERVLGGIDLKKMFSDGGARIAFANDCGQLMSEMALSFGVEETAASRVCVLLEPRLFSRFLSDAHPLGWFVTFILENIYLNQNEEEKNRGTLLLKSGVPLREVFANGHLYRSFRRFLHLFVVASPGVLTIYKDRSARADLESIMPISIVILAWNRWDLTEKCLRSVFSYPLPKEVELIVVDNGSTDVTPVALARLAESIPQLKHLKLPANAGPAGGREAALSTSRGKTLVFLDNDVEVKNERWLDILLEPLLFHPRVGATGAFGVLHTHDETETWSQKLLFPGMVVPVCWLSSFCIAVRRQALIDAGGWRPDLYPLYGMEDVALGYALRAAGWGSAVPGQFVPITHGMNHRDGHYDYDIGESGKKNTEHFTRLWGPRHRLLNAARSNRTLAGAGVSKEASTVSSAK